MNDPASRPVTAASLWGPCDPPPLTVVNPNGRVPVVLVCDHASNAIPAVFGQLGLDPEALSQHIAASIGWFTTDFKDVAFPVIPADALYLLPCRLELC